MGEGTREMGIRLGEGGSFLRFLLFSSPSGFLLRLLFLILYDYVSFSLLDPGKEKI